MKPFLAIFFLIAVTSTGAEVCTPDAFYRIECNSCRCTLDGSASICTQWICPPGIYNPDGSFAVPIDLIQQIIPDITEIEVTPSETLGTGLSFSDQICSPNAYFYKDCNICQCSSSGNSYYCIHKDCQAKRSAKKVSSDSKRRGHLSDETVTRSGDYILKYKR